MTLRGWLLSLVALGACGRERPDPRLAEVQAPVHVTVRVIDVAVEKNCEGTLSQQLSCLVTRALRSGCVYVEAGAEADAPERRPRPDVGRCGSLAYAEHRFLLRNEPVRKASLFLEPGGERVLIDLVDTVHALYLRDGVAVLQKPFSRPTGLTRPDGSVDWTLVPPFLAVLDEAQLRDLTEARLDALLAKTPGGRDALTESLLALTGSASAAEQGFDLAYSRLDEPGRQRVREAMITALSEGNDGAVQWFLRHKEEQGLPVVEALEDAMTLDGYTTAVLLPALLELAPQRAEKVACDQLEQRWHQTAPSGVAEYEGSMPPDATVLAVLVERKAQCPWVLPLLEREPCSWELHCDPDFDDGKETPLCTAEQADKVLQRTLHPNPDADVDEDEEEDPTSDWGALLMAAARIQGPLPQAFSLANERRQYQLSSTIPEDADEDPCAEVTPAPADWACRLPPGITTAKNQGCRLRLDDAKKTITLSAVELDAGVPLPLPRPWSLHHE